MCPCFKIVTLHDMQILLNATTFGFSLDDQGVSKAGSQNSLYNLSHYTLHA